MSKFAKIAYLVLRRPMYSINMIRHGLKIKNLLLKAGYTHDQIHKNVKIGQIRAGFIVLSVANKHVREYYIYNTRTGQFLD